MVSPPVRSHQRQWRIGNATVGRLGRVYHLVGVIEQRFDAKTQDFRRQLMALSPTAEEALSWLSKSCLQQS